MEDTSLLSPLSLFAIIIFLVFLNFVIIIQDFYSTFWHVLHFFCNVVLFLWRCSKKRNGNLLTETETGCTKGNIETTMPITNRIPVEEVKKIIDNSEILYDHLGGEELFEKNEMFVEEVEDAFRVFDENGDGFIDEGELKEVLCSLGFDECTKIECKMMINVFDDNGDGRIDFREFVKLLEKSFS